MINKILIAFLSLVAATTVVGQNTVMVNNSNAVITYPLNFWSANAVQGRTGLGLGSAATNSASAFQPSSGVLSNLASSNAVNLTNLRATNIVGVIPASNIPSTTLTNIPATNIVGTVALASNVTGTIAISNGGTGATNAGGARTNLGLGSTNDVAFNIVGVSKITSGGVAPTHTLDIINGTLQFLTNNIISWGSEDVYFSVPLFFTSTTNAATTRTNLGLGWAALTNTNATNFRTAIGATAVGESIFTATNAATARTNLGATTIGNALFTATNSAAAINAIGISTNFSDQALSVQTLVLPEATGLSSATAYGIQFRRIFPSSNGLIALSGTDDQGQTTLRISTGTMSGTTAEVALFNSSRVTFYEPLDFNNTTNAATTRTNLGLGWAALTNTSASGFGAALYGSNTNPVLVNTNGQVVSPTNFWQVAPISTIVQYQTNVTGTSTNAATNSRNLFLFSLTPSVSGVTNTVTLPTNAATTFEGDRATIIHLATNSANTVTAIRQLGAATNLITLNQADETVLLMYRSGAWGLSDNISYIEPIYFSGTNAAANAAASRTNLGGTTVGNAVFTATNAASAATAIGLGATDYVTFRNLTLDGGTNATTDEVSLNMLSANGQWSLFSIPTSDAPPASQVGGDLRQGSLWLYDNRLYQKIGGTISSDNEWGKLLYLDGDGGATNARSGLGLAVTNNVTFSNVTASGTLTATSTVTAKTNLVVEGFVDFTTNRTNNSPVSGANFSDRTRWLQIKIGTNNFYVPLFQ